MTKKPLKKKVRKDHSVNAAPANKKANKIKAIILLVVALFFFAYMIYSGGTILSFFSLVIGLVCALMGIITLREGRKKKRR